MPTAGGLIQWFINFLDWYVVPLVFAIAFIVFIWGVYNAFIKGGADEDEVKEGRHLVLYGLIGFFVMFSVWGLVNLLVNTLGFNAWQRPQLPMFGSSNGSAQSGSGLFNDTSSSSGGVRCSSVGNACDYGESCNSSGYCVPDTATTNPPANTQLNSGGGGSIMAPGGNKSGTETNTKTSPTPTPAPQPKNPLIDNANLQQT